MFALPGELGAEILLEGDAVAQQVARPRVLYHEATDGSWRRGRTRRVGPTSRQSMSPKWGWAIAEKDVPAVAGERQQGLTHAPLPLRARGPLGGFEPLLFWRQRRALHEADHDGARRQVAEPQSVCRWSAWRPRPAARKRRPSRGAEERPEEGASGTAPRAVGPGDDDEAEGPLAQRGPEEPVGENVVGDGQERPDRDRQEDLLRPGGRAFQDQDRARRPAASVAQESSGQCSRVGSTRTTRGIHTRQITTESATHASSRSVTRGRRLSRRRTG